MENFIVISDDFFDEEVNIIKMLIGKWKLDDISVLEIFGLLN